MVFLYDVRQSNYDFITAMRMNNLVDIMHKLDFPISAWASVFGTLSTLSLIILQVSFTRKCITVDNF